jgi:transcription-repair coupling factor (superfamily II helicase)
MAFQAFEDGTAASAPPRDKFETGEIAARLLTALEEGDLVFLAADEVRAAEVARAIRAAAPETDVLFCPGSDALPGDSAPPSPANVGQRTAALRKLAARDGRRVALISTGEAAARLYPPRGRYGAAPPLVGVGEAIDIASFAASLEEIGYVADERVDEPGEVAARGQVIDVFPADAGEPYRIEEQDGRVASIRSYDPASQLTRGECDALELGRVTEPKLGEGVTLLDHLPEAPVAFDAGADRRRRRFLALAADAAKRRPARAVRDVCPDARWQQALAARTALALHEGIGEPPPRFVERRAPERAFAKFAREAMAGGERLVLLGTARDLRFLGRRIAKGFGAEPTLAASWVEAVAAAGPGTIAALEVPVSRGFRIGGVVGIAAADLLGSRAGRETDAPAAATRSSSISARSGSATSSSTRITASALSKRSKPFRATRAGGAAAATRSCFATTAARGAWSRSPRRTGSGATEPTRRR